MSHAGSSIVDRHQRPLRDLRLSVTDRCNFRCRYCMPEEIFGPDYTFLPRQELLTFEEMERLVRLFVQLGVKKVRITGGEPLLRRDLPLLVRKIRRVKGVKDLALTTNAFLLDRYAVALQKAGLDRINVSLDALDDEVFANMNGGRSSVEKVLSGIDAATRAGLAVKVNMVVQKGVNDHQILPMARYFYKKGIPLRFIEFMDVGNHNGWNTDQVVSKQEILHILQEELPLEPLEPGYFGEVATRYRYRDTQTEVGIISSVTDSFCGSCTRARLSADGKLYTCLFASAGADLRGPLRAGEEDEQLLQRISGIWGKRADRYSDERAHNSPRSRQKVEMSYIGG
ncbi:cyclic pyranopterin monophosphate synthase [Marinithermofilum abyssi]|uniref:GTP 3',8-cyclase n=1 Tax=Marinithermofilum abyssi TaxID=1571185 RepID=A0A8J2VC97_9BACL|nr:GTP 3',8-cyclase MoaA [Marinithermofilum abyssi]GGE24057.1 cyclic pyranopterin monophosphate synthase [Marinithermofilum abyssi]